MNRFRNVLGCCVAVGLLVVGLVTVVDPGKATAAAALPPGGLVDSVPGFGRTQGTFSVSADGAAQYRLPLWVPTGHGLVTPDLALAYSSRAGNGPLGVGWSLNGLSTITPCPHTIAQDGFTDGVHFDGSDGFCLDGNRLMPTSAPQLPEREYGTESDMFARVTAFGMTDNEPDSFRVFTKDQKILTFGQSTNSRLQAFRLKAGPDPGGGLIRESTTRVTVAWQLERVEDHNGNVATIEYERAEGTASTLWHVESRPSVIRYAPNREVHFSYGPRTDPIDSYSRGVHTREPRVLKLVTMLGGPQGGATELLRSYVLTYNDGNHDSITERSQLHTITECDHDATCKQPLVLQWSAGNYGFDSIPTDITDAGTTDDSGRRLIVGDLNNDGRDDLFYPNSLDDEPRRLNETRTRFSTSDGFGAAHLAGIPVPVPQTIPPYRPDFRPVDFDRDGRLDMVTEEPVIDHPDRTELALFRFNGADYDPYTPDIDDNHLSSGLFVPRDPAYFLDLDGNGMPDYATPREVGPAPPGPGRHAFQWHYRFNSGANGSDRFVPSSPVATQGERGISTRVRALDSDGDGREELLGLSYEPPYRYSTFGVRQDGGEETRPVNLAEPAPDTAADSKDLTFADVNGDGLADAVYVLTGLRTQLNSGNGFGSLIDGPGPDEYRIPPTFGGTNSAYDPGVRVGDFNNDGRDDILIVYPGVPTGPSDHLHGAQVFTWTDNHFVGIPLNRAAGGGMNPLSFYGFAATQPLDIDGDGVLDIVYVEGNHLQILKRLGPMPDQLVGIGDLNVGPRVDVEYATLGDRTVFTPGVCTYPLVCPGRGGSVVARHTLSSRFGTTTFADEYTHHYEGARIDVQGRGWLGFEEHDVTRVATGAKTVTRFDNTTSDKHGSTVYPFAMIPKTVTYTVKDSPTGRESRHTVASPPTVRRTSGGGYTVELRDVVDTQEERPVGAPTWQLLRTNTTTTTYDAFGNKDLVVSTTANGRKVTEDPTFRNDTTAWLIGLPTRQLTTGCTAAAVCTTRESTFGYDDRGNQTVSILEPGKPDLEMTVTTAFGDVGQVSSVKTAASGGPSRTNTIEYNGDKLYPTATIDALHHRTTIETDSGLGVPLKVTDPNGVPSTMRYDRFGRPRETNRADGSFERIAHAFSSGVSTVTSTLSGGGVTVVLTDELDREVQRQVKGFDGRMATTYTNYDALGRVHQVSQPAFPGDPVFFTTTDYDGRDRVTTVTAPDTVKVRHTYLNLETHTFDGKNVETSTVSTVDGDVGTSVEGALRTQYAYGPFGELTKVTAPDTSVRSMTYDVLGRRKGMVDPSSGTTSTTYNAFGEVTTETDGANATTTYVHDELGRAKTITSPDGVATNTWDTATHGIGKLANARSADGVVTTYTYDPVGHPSTATWNVEGTQYQIGYGYDDIGRAASTTYPAVPGTNSRLAINYRYNPSGFLLDVRDAAANGPVYWTALGRDAAGQLTKERYDNGVVTDYAIDQRTGLLSQETNTGPGTNGVLGKIAYLYDNNRNVAFRSDTVHARTEQFGYDTLNRLDHWFNTAAHIDATYSYDNVGNLQTETFQRGTEARQTTTYAYGANGAPKHALTSRNGLGYTYDGAGRQKTGDGRTIEYTSTNLPKVMTWGQGQRTDFSYDASGARVLKRGGARSILTVGGLFERNVNGGEIDNINNIVVDGRVVAQVNRLQAPSGGPVTSTKTFYLNGDMQGSTGLVTNSAGGLADTEGSRLRELFYDPFGRRVGADYTPLENNDFDGAMARFGYDGQEHDDELGLINMTGRVYDPEQRRFLTPDPVISRPLSSQGQNRYAYVFDNPATLTDPTGFTPVLSKVFGPAGCSLFGSGSTDDGCGGAKHEGIAEPTKLLGTDGGRGSAPVSDDESTVDVDAVSGGSTDSIEIPGETIVVHGTHQMINKDDYWEEDGAFFAQFGTAGEPTRYTNRTVWESAKLASERVRSGSPGSEQFYRGMAALGWTMGKAAEAAQLALTVYAGVGLVRGLAELGAEALMADMAAQGTIPAEGALGAAGVRVVPYGLAAAEDGAALAIARRVTLRQATKSAIQDAAPRTPGGDFIDPNTGQVIPRGGPFDYGHKPGYEWWRTQEMATEGGWTRQEVIEYENDPSHYQIEAPGPNRSHRYEMP